MRRAAKQDANHAAIRDALRDAGCEVVDTSAVGGGWPDLVAFRDGRVLLVEVKNPNKPPSARKLTDAQRDLHARIFAAGTVVHVVTSPAEAVALLGVKP